MANNFLQWNPTCANQESDVAYAGDAQRSGGATNPSVFDATLANKLFYQTTILVTALTQMLTNKGYAPNDGSASPGTALANLESVLANLLTFNDLTATLIDNTLGYTPVNQGGGVNQSPTVAIKIGQDIANNGHARMTMGVTDIGDLALVGVDSMALPSNNLRLQMGDNGGSTSVTFATPFSGQPKVFLGMFNGTANIVNGSVTNNGFSLNLSGGGQLVDYLAIGPK